MTFLELELEKERPNRRSICYCTARRLEDVSIATIPIELVWWVGGNALSLRFNDFFQVFAKNFVKTHAMTFKHLQFHERFSK